jgi:putative spermidine/putrescine transport system substrate-binding protein
MVAWGSAAILAVGGCASGGAGSGMGGSSSLPPSSTAYPGPVGRGEGTLGVLAWPGYAEDGTVDPAVDWVTPFTEETGCRVEVTVFGSSDEAVALTREGGWDVVLASGDVSPRLISDGVVQPVNTALVPHYADIVPGLKDQPWNTVDGVNYGVPQGRGVAVLLVDADVVQPLPDSWSVTFEADSPYGGRIGAFDSPISIAGAAVYLMAARPDLGVTNPYSLDRAQFDAAIDVLEQQRDLVDDYWLDYPTLLSGFESGATVASAAWLSYATMMAGLGLPVVSVKPAEGTTGWSDTWMIAKDAPNIDCAYLWLDWMASPAINAQVAEYVGEAPANERACALTSVDDYCTTVHALDADYWRDVYYWTMPTTRCLDGRIGVECVPYSEWVDAWLALRTP